MIDTANAARFWGAVEDCLVEFHGIERDAAAHLVTSFWRRLVAGQEQEFASRDQHVAGPGPTAMELVYHSEPWYVAADLAGQNWCEGPPAHRRGQYGAILRAHQLSSER